MHHCLLAVVILLVGASGITACNNTLLSASRSADYVVDGGAGQRGLWRDNRQYEANVQIETLYEDGLHDPGNESLEVLQDPREALSAFPYDRRGEIDWVRALDLGIIEPRSNLVGTNEIMTMDMDILFKDTGDMPWVKFPHITHTKWLDCSNCHPKIFIPQKGANNPSMDGILAGEHCGRCHDKVAFSLWVCERCHNVPHENSPDQWWGEEKNKRFN
ncbi:MAG: hypothetical protein GXP08_07985 [Gammaproteobacteria bacterium]|nr:hypothetical protein [Gammaproteobacteria bacterium]